MSGNKVLLILLEVWLPQCFCSFDIKQNRQRLSSWCLTWSPNLLCISATTSKLIRLCAVHQQMGSTYTVIHIKSRWRMYYRGTQCWGWCVKSSIKAGGYSLGRDHQEDWMVKGKGNVDSSSLFMWFLSAALPSVRRRRRRPHDDGKKETRQIKQGEIDFD